MPVTEDDIKNAKQDEMKRKADAKQAELKKKEKEENEAPRKAVSDAVDYIKSKIGFKHGGAVSSASSRADGCAQRGKTRGKMV